MLAAHWDGHLMGACMAPRVIARLSSLAHRDICCYRYDVRAQELSVVVGEEVILGDVPIWLPYHAARGCAPLGPANAAILPEASLSSPIDYNLHTLFILPPTN